MGPTLGGLRAGLCTRGALAGASADQFASVMCARRDCEMEKEVRGFLRPSFCANNNGESGIWRPKLGDYTARYGTLADARDQAGRHAVNLSIALRGAAAIWGLGC
jgi:hypothetical protein